MARTTQSQPGYLILVTWRPCQLFVWRRRVHHVFPALLLALHPRWRRWALLWAATDLLDYGAWLPDLRQQHAFARSRPAVR